MSFREEILGEGIRLINADCREVLPTLGKVDAVVTDPAYGVNAARDRNSQKWGWRDYGAPGWDKERTPPDVVALAVAAGHHAIVWGGNYFTDALPPSSKWLIWDKGQTDFSLADVELAWCSFDGAARRFTYPRVLAMQDGKEHPTQKPIALMRWCIERIPPPCCDNTRSVSRQRNDRNRRYKTRAEIYRYRTGAGILRHRLPTHLRRHEAARPLHRACQASQTGGA